MTTGSKVSENSPPYSMQLLLLLALLFGCAGNGRPVLNEESIGTENDVVEKVFGGNANFGIMRTADAVSACRLKLLDDLKSHLPSAYEEGPCIEVPTMAAARLKCIFTSPTSYVFDLQKPCAPEYGVRLKFASDDGKLYIDLCFGCDDLAVVRDGRIVGGEDVSRARPQLVAWCKELFPDDAEIQRLKR